MEFEKIVEQRASVRRFKKEKISRDKIRKIIELTKRAPSWKNTQAVRYIVIDDDELISKMANVDVAGGFEYNVKTIKNSAALVIQTYVEGLSGYEKDGSYSTDKGDRWQMYDAGISASVFVLAAYAQGIGTVIQGYFDEKFIRKYVEIPHNQHISALICMGYADGEIKTTPRLNTEEVVDFYEK